MSETEMPMPSMNLENLYKEEVYTDLQVGTIRKLTPVQANGERDEARPLIYSGQAQMMTPAGALPLNFDIPAASLEEACEKFADSAKEAMEQTIEELKEMRRQAASSIVVPGESPGGMGGMGGLGGGKIQL